MTRGKLNQIKPSVLSDEGWGTWRVKFNYKSAENLHFGDDALDSFFLQIKNR